MMEKEVVAATVAAVVALAGMGMVVVEEEMMATIGIPVEKRTRRTRRRSSRKRTRRRPRRKKSRGRERKRKQRPLIRSAGLMRQMTRMWTTSGQEHLAKRTRRRKAKRSAVMRFGAL